ncbi:hypothetical protein OI25_3000 [Paraburkholderia fungorum]|uniref:Uncharacterized protein n=1 Tax=Paraburkholderia fungorum TaxID=134537 RepID=A0AAU8T3T7_9BURK|nr:hypothetical protein OI25_3000 [Paraburkholderia fungorum]
MAMLRQAEAGMPVADLIRLMCISEQTVKPPPNWTT